MRKIKLTQGKYALVDDEDFDRVNQFKWWAIKSPSNNWRAVRQKNRLNIYMHKFILGENSFKIIDHINGDSLDNRKSNLRYCSYSQNNMNSKIKSHNTTGHKGVSFVRRVNKYRVQIMCNKIRYNLGYFKDINDAAKAYNAKALELHGEFARVNTNE